jgi:hypothetical protein
VSLYNETEGRAIVPTPAIGGVGVLEKAEQAIGLAMPAKGDLVLIGESQGWLGQSLWLREIAGREEGAPPPVDLVAERIRSLDVYAPGTYSQFAKLTSIKEANGVPKAEAMIKELVAGHEAVVRTARSIFPVVDKASDEASADLLTQRMQLHEKTAWMLRSLLEK